MSRRFAVPTRGGHDRVLGPPTPDESGRPLVRGLLQAAGIAAANDGLAGEHGVEDLGARGLPLIELRDAYADRTRYCVATSIDDRGRLADRTPLKVLAWSPGAPITITMMPSAGIVIVRRTGIDAVSRQGYLRLPADIRHGCRICTGDRLLIVAHPDDGVLVGYTQVALDAMASAYHAVLAAVDSS
jgi:hypothetical protein